MKNIVVLGIGNRLMMDDGVGVYIVEELRDKNTNNNIKFVVGETDLDYCLDEVRDSDFLIIIDAIKIGKNPGEICQISLSDIEPVANDSQHNLSIINSIKLYYKELNGFVIGIEPFEIGFNVGISECMKEKIGEIVGEVEGMIWGEVGVI